MPLNPRQERFVQNLVAKGMNATAAYKAAGYSGKGHAAEQGAHQILRNSEVKSRIAEFQAQAASEAKITVISLTDDLIRLRNLAEANNQPAAGVAAVGMIAKLHGLVVDRQEVRAEILRKPVSDPDAPPDMPFDDWSRKYGGKVIEH